ncbi:MAG: endonuclease III [Hyphomicrobiaceae bacterium]
MTRAKSAKKPAATKGAGASFKSPRRQISAARSPEAPPKRKTSSSRSRRARMPPEAVKELFRRFATADPSPKGELEHVNAFTLLVAVVLSAQATDAGVNKATRALFAAADTPEKMVALGEERVREMIKTIGLFRNKAKNVVALSEALIAHHGGEVPRDREALEALPGVGRKTANVVLNTAFGEPTIAVDTHLFRLANRLSLAPGKTPLEVEKTLMKVVPSEYLLNAHHWLILHGRYICKAQRPRCEVCPIQDLCTAPDKAVT